MNRVAFRVSLVLAALLVSQLAFGSDGFPDVVQATLNLPAPPPACTLCHQTLIGGLNTVIKPFGITVHVKYGVKMQDQLGLRNALLQMQANGDDSDGDGVGDVVELQRGTDPNVPEGGTAVDEPRYGCNCTAVRARSGFSAVGIVWLSGLALSCFRRQRGARAGRERET